MRFGSNALDTRMRIRVIDDGVATRIVVMIPSCLRMMTRGRIQFD